MSILKQPSTCPIEPFTVVDNGTSLSFQLKYKDKLSTENLMFSGPTRYSDYDTFWSQLVATGSGSTCLNPMLFNQSYINTNSATMQTSMNTLQAYLSANNLPPYVPPTSSTSSINATTASNLQVWGGFIIRILFLMVLLYIILTLIPSSKLTPLSKILIIVSIVIIYAIIDITFMYVSGFKPTLCKATCGC